jgi:pyruvate kinase
MASDLMDSISTPTDTPASVASSAVTAANTGECAAIICLSTTGETARLISKFRPRCPIFIVSRDLMTCRQAHLSRGCYPVPYTKEAVTPWERDVNERIEHCVNQGLLNKFLSSGDSIVAVHGWKSGGHSTNTVRVLAVP